MENDTPKKHNRLLVALPLLLPTTIESTSFQQEKANVTADTLLELLLLFFVVGFVGLKLLIASSAARHARKKRKPAEGGCSLLEFFFVPMSNDTSDGTMRWFAKDGWKAPGKSKQLRQLL